MKYIVTLVLGLIISVCSFSSENSEKLVWSKKPIPIVLKVGKERIIHFPQKVQHWIPNTLDDVLIAESVDDTVYIKAISDFSPFRIRVRTIETQKVYLFDVSTKETSSAPDRVFIIDREDDPVLSKIEKDVAVEQDWRVVLTRYASQVLYGPERLLENYSDIREIKIDYKKSIPLIRGGSVDAVPIASWMAHGWYVHAVKIENRASESVRLDPRIAYRGDWSTVTLQHLELGPRHSDTSVTTLYLTSRRTLQESLNSGFGG